MNPCELTALITTIANILSSKLTNEEITLLAAVFVQLGDTLATIATTKTIYQDQE